MKFYFVVGQKGLIVFFCTCFFVSVENFWTSFPTPSYAIILAAAVPSGLRTLPAFGSTTPRSKCTAWRSSSVRSKSFCETRKRKSSSLTCKNFRMDSILKTSTTYLSNTCKTSSLATLFLEVQKVREIYFSIFICLIFTILRLEWNSKISDLWTTDGRIIIAYDETTMVSTYPWLWRRVEHKWGDVRTPEDLFTYLTGREFAFF